MFKKIMSGRKKEKQEKSEDDEQEGGVNDDRIEEDRQKKIPTKGKKKRKAREKQRKEELKSKATGVGLKISVDGDSAPTNKKLVFDDSNLPTEEDDNDDSTSDKIKDEKLASDILMGGKEDNEDDDDDRVEEVKGKAARDEIMDQMETEAKQSLKTEKKRKRKPRKEKAKETVTKEKEGNDSDDDDEEMDEDFFAQLDSVRKVELEERKELEKSAARAASKGRYTTFVFAKNENDDDTLSDPVQIDENIQVVVLKNPSSNSDATGNSSFLPNTSVTEKALLYSRNLLQDGSDRAAGATEMKRKLKRSGEDIQPWKRARQRLSMGRSRLTKGRPAAFFKTKKR